MASLRVFLIPALVFSSDGLRTNVRMHEAADESQKVTSTQTVTDFDGYVAAFGRSYRRNSTEYALRKPLFERVLQEVRAQNERPERLWTAGLNLLSDRTAGELSMLRGWRRTPSAAGTSGHLSLLEVASAKLAKSTDWTSLSQAFIRDQGACGSCWAVATTTMLDTRFEVQAKSNRTFSTQEVVSCVKNPDDCGGSGGCDGATVELAMAYIQANGLGTAQEFPYVAEDTKCMETAKLRTSGLQAFRGVNSSPDEKNLGLSQLGLTGWAKLPENKALPLMQAVVTGPVAISVDASGWSTYLSGIFDSCSPDATIDHAVTLMGYGSAGKTNYWLVQNSWGSLWGEEGRIRVFRAATPEEDDKACGTDFEPEVGTACKPYPDSVRVCGMCGLLYDSVVASFKAAS